MSLGYGSHELAMPRKPVTKNNGPLEAKVI